MNYYIFNYKSKQTQKLYTVIFDYKNNRFDAKTFQEEIYEFHTYNSIAKDLVFLLPHNKENVANIENEIETTLSIQNINIHLYNSVGEFYLTDKTKVLESIIDEILYEGVLSIFVNRNGILEADNTFHYVLPSGKHSKFFIRVGNILNKDCEIYFIALSILRKFPKNIKVSKIYCDSASIISIIPAIKDLRNILDDPLNLPYESFGSYDNIEDFIPLSYSFIIISASNSGDLEKKILKKDATVNFLTIVLNSEKDAGINHLLNINNDQKCKDKLSFEQFPNEIKCNYCQKDNSVPVLIKGEQFLPSKIKIQEILLSKKHIPEWIKDFIRQFAYRGIIKCHKGEKTNKKREFYIDISSLHENFEVDYQNCLNTHKGDKNEVWKQFKYKLNYYKFLENEVPHNIKRIIYLKDKASETIAKKMHLYIKERFKEEIPDPISEFEIKEDDFNFSGTILVIASCLATGRRLHNISRDLRKKNISIIYFVSMTRSISNRNFEILKENLEYKDDEIAKNKFHTLSKLYTRDNHTEYGTIIDNSPWGNEYKFLVKAQGKYESEFPEALQVRIEEISTNDGLEDNLFYKNPFDDKELKLRKNFAFYNFANCICYEDDKDIKQSEVYFLISSILHNLRAKDIESGINDRRKEKPNIDYYLIQHEHLRTVLSPDCFIRYNDGILQACILRGAKPAELDYTIDFKYSYEMKKFLIELFKNTIGDSCEAVIEFLYAISCGKLKLLKSDMLDIVDEVKRNKTLSEHSIVKFYAFYISNELLKELTQETQTVNDNVFEQKE